MESKINFFENGDYKLITNLINDKMETLKKYKNFNEQYTKLYDTIDELSPILDDTQKEKFNEAMATMLSCKLSIKANQNITLEEMENLINDLRKCKNPFNCPHGRPTLIFYSNSELEKLFKRSGF